MFTNEIRPYKSHADYRNKSCDAVYMTHMCVLYVKSRGFHGSECRFYLPSLLVGHDSTLGAIETYENLQLWNSIGVFDPAACKIDILAFVKKKLEVEFLLSDFEIVEQPPRANSLACGRLYNPEVLPDTEIISDAIAVEPSNPLLSDELAVCHKAVDAVRAEKTDESFHYLAPFFPIGVPPFGKEAEYQRKGNPLIRYAQHKYIDVAFSELPVGTIHAQNKICLDRKQRENHTGDNVKIKNILGEESLKASHVGVLVNGSRHCIGKFMEAHCLHHTEGMEEQRHEFYACQIHILSKMLLHNREDLVNFDQVLGISSFHEKKRRNFSFKLLNFRDFYNIFTLKLDV